MSVADEIVDNKFSFKKGYNKVPFEHVRKVRLEIMKALDVNRQNFYKRLNGDVEPRVSEAEAIEKVFKKYNITKIWGS